MQIPSDEWRKLSHRERRRLINKERRRWRRKALAQKREEEQSALEEDPDYLEKVCEEERCRLEEERKREAQSRLEEEAWLQREREAQEKFRRQREKEEKLQREKEERERLIREEWEALQQREREEEEKREKAKREKEERLKEALSVGDKPRVSEQPWHNPLAPDDLPLPSMTSTVDYGTEKDTQNCSFFLKTGVCRYGDRCSKKHPRPLTSTTLLIPSMYSSLGLVEQMLNERNQDAGIEYDEGDLYEHFVQFYQDALPEFSKAGKVVQFKVSCNHQPHLRGNVYVQYASEEECSKAYQMFNGRWYAQKQLSCEFCPVQKWKSAICGLFSHKRCPKGNQCNFLHVFRNPGDAFSRADRDLPPLSPSSSPPNHSRRRSFQLSRRYSGNGRRSRDRSRDRNRDRSRERSRRRRSRSRSRRQSRSPEVSGSRWRSRYHSRSRSRSRSRSQMRGRESKSQKSSRRYKRRGSRSRSRAVSSSRSMSSGRSGHSRDSSLERQPTSPTHGSKVMDSDSEKRSITGRHSSRKKKRKHHHHHHQQSKSPESLEQKHSKKEKKKHKSKKKHKRGRAHGETKPSNEHEEESSHQMEDEPAQDSVGSVLEGGGKAHVESSTGPEIVVEPNTREDVPNDVLVNDEPTVEQQEDQMTPVPVGVASPPQPDQSATEE